MATTLLNMLALASVLVSAETTWSENLVLADCGIGLGPNGGSTSREMMYYSADAWGAPKYMRNVPWDGSYPWRESGVSQTLPNGDRWTVFIKNGVGDPNYAGFATHTYDNVALTCWSRHLDGLFTLADGKKCSMAYICNHAPGPKPSPAPSPSPAPKPPNPSPAPDSRPLAEHATPGALKYQPVIDFDKSACYNTAVITRDGHVNDGLELGQGDCRKLETLHNSNTYVREKCTSDGWCFYLYGYYFEKDESGTVGGGHKNDWEHVAVWTYHNEVSYLDWSAHGKYNSGKAWEVEWEGNHPKFVIHRDWGSTHAFRRAKKNEKPENASGTWYRSPLVSWEWMDPTLRGKLNSHSWGSAVLDLTDGRFDKAYDATREAPREALRDASQPPHLEL